MKHASLLVLAVIASGCLPTGTDDRPTVIATPPAVRSAPATITVDGQPIVLGATLYRDFMPVSPSQGKPLVVIATVHGADPAVMTTAFRFASLWVVRGDRAWVARFEPAVSIPEVAAVMANTGPRWGPDEIVDVVARLRLPAGGEALLAVRGVRILRTD